MRGISIAVWILLEGYYIFRENLEATILWVVLPLIFGPLLYWSWYSKHFVLRFFILLVFLSYCIGVPFFFIGRETFSYSGWGAVKDFDFSLSQFFPIYSQFYIFVVMVVCATLLLQKVLFAENMLDIVKNLSTSILLSRRKRDRRSQYVYGVSLLTTVLAASLLNIWMYNHSIGLSGLTQPTLPFRMTGGLYYFTKLVLPIVVIVLYLRSSQSWTLSIVCLSYSIWAAFSQVSGSNAAFFALPLMIVAISNKRRGLALLSFFVFIIGWIGAKAARDLVYVAKDSFDHGGVPINLPSVIYETIANYDPSHLLEGVFGILSRVGGAQGLILGYKLDPEVVGGSLGLLKSFFLAQPFHENLTYELLGIDLPPATGFSLGFFGTILGIAGGAWAVLFLLSLLVSVCLTLGEILLRVCIRRTGSPGIGFSVGGIYVYFFYVTGDLSYFYYYTLLACVFIYVYPWIITYLRQTSRTYKSINFSH